MAGFNRWSQPSEPRRRTNQRHCPTVVSAAVDPRLGLTARERSDQTRKLIRNSRRSANTTFAQFPVIDAQNTDIVFAKTPLPLRYAISCVSQIL
jgi:hypothetical protein